MSKKKDTIDIEHRKNILNESSRPSGGMVDDETIENIFNYFLSGDSDEVLSDDEAFRDFSEEYNEISESENLFKEAKEAYNKVDDKLLDFIGNFVVNQDKVAKQKKKLKNIFFWFAMICFAFIVLTPIICLIVLMIFNVSDYYIIFGAISAALLEVLTTVIVLPKIVAEYLFNKEEENANIKIVELMQKYSDTMHGYEK